MQMIYQSERMAIVLDDAASTIISDLSSASTLNIPLPILGRAMAAAPSLLFWAWMVSRIEPDKRGNRKLTGDFMAAIWPVIDTFDVSHVSSICTFNRSTMERAQ